jgi:hypothetical protein
MLDRVRAERDELADAIEDEAPPAEGIYQSVRDRLRLGNLRLADREQTIGILEAEVSRLSGVADRMREDADRDREDAARWRYLRDTHLATDQWAEEEPPVDHACTMLVLRDESPSAPGWFLTPEQIVDALRGASRSAGAGTTTQETDNHTRGES